MDDQSARVSPLADGLRIELARIRVPIRPAEHEARHDVLPSSWTESDQLLFDIVSWSIAEYYDGG